MTTTHISTIQGAIYCRISDDRAGGGLGVERQRKDCVKLAERLGWSVAGTYSDNDISAYSGKRRPEYERLLADISAGSITGLLTWHPDRLHRSPLELERLIDILERNSVSVQSVTTGPIDLATPSGRAVARTLGAWARFESEHKSERIKAKKREQALAGARTGLARRAYGYTIDETRIVPDEARVIRTLMRKLLRGQSTVQLRDYLAASGVLTSQGNEWSPGGVARMLVSARIAGWRSAPPDRSRSTYFGGEFLAKAVWPAIVSRADVERAREILTDETVRAGSNKRYLLSGILICGKCGMAMTSMIADRTDRRYHCMFDGDPDGHCSSISISRLIEDEITDQLLRAVRGGLLHRLHTLGDAAYEGDRAIVREVERKIRQLGRAENGVWMTSHERRKERNRLVRRATGAYGTVQALRETDLADLLRSRRTFRSDWDQLTMRQRRNIIQILIKSIVVMPGQSGHHKLNKRRIQVTWRG